MKSSSRRGFTLMELAVALSVIGAFIGGVWVAAGASRENSHYRQAMDNVTLAVDAVRAAYMGQSAIVGGANMVVPALVSRAALPPNMVRQSGATCSYTNCLDSPWGGAAAGGTMAICSWTYGADKHCATAGAASNQYFGVEYSGLNNNSCIEVAENISTSAPAGLVDVFINDTDMGALGALPPSSVNALAKCNSGAGANTVDFVYALRLSGS
ncbi:MAG: prepilin-type N-terminal cleavage/methylation domain-containing protein [Alphaproteobacteria bacterium]|nr:prepilin-type N-terminal cleavage/methylation domain-containing protein [Alphaproteobacteria bacterium]